MGTHILTLYQFISPYGVSSIILSYYLSNLLRILLGEHDTKHAVLKELNEISLIHLAAHGDAVRGEICLAPIR